MGRRSIPNPSNVEAASELIPIYAKRLVEAYSEALGALADVAAERAVPTTLALDALAHLHHDAAAIRELERQLAGLIILGGGSMRMTAAAVRVKPKTLGLRLPGTWASVAGHDLVRAPDKPDGWWIR